MADYEKLAREIRQHHLPWDEFFYLAAPGGVLDQLQADIACALERAALEGKAEAASYCCTHQGLSRLRYLRDCRTRLAELKEGK